MWEYFDKNVCMDGRPVAKFKNKNGYTIYYVHTAEGGYSALPQIDGIKSVFVRFSEARRLNTPEEEAQENSHDVLVSAMKHACEIIEENYNEQVEKLISIIY